MLIREHAGPEECFNTVKIEARIPITWLIWLILVKNGCKSNATREKNIQNKAEREVAKHCEYRNSILAVVLTYVNLKAI